MRLTKKQRNAYWKLYRDNPVKAENLLAFWRLVGITTGDTDIGYLDTVPAHDQIRVHLELLKAKSHLGLLNGQEAEHYPKLERLARAGLKVDLIYLLLGHLGCNSMTFYWMDPEPPPTCRNMFESYSAISKRPRSFQ